MALSSIAATVPNVPENNLIRFREAIRACEEIHSGLRSSGAVREYFLRLNTLLEQALLIAPENPEFMQFVSNTGLLTDLLRLFINRTGLIYTGCSDEALQRFLQGLSTLDKSLQIDLLSELSAVCSRESREKIGSFMLKEPDILSPQAIYRAVVNGIINFDRNISCRLRSLCLNCDKTRPEGMTPSLADPLYVSVKLYLFRFITDDEVFSDLVPQDFISLLHYPERYDFSGFHAFWWPILIFRRFISHAAKRRDNRELLTRKLKDYRRLCTVPVTRKLDEIIQILNEA
ncbi:MAG: hypothetical protein K5985_06405 [Lachnospiraceae bacterium]|nr:hypothetical protein [Lachnospiraceae bacterium]